jgi:hypothetical protein
VAPEPKLPRFISEPFVEPTSTPETRVVTSAPAPDVVAKPAKAPRVRKPAVKAAPSEITTSQSDTPEAAE